MKNCKKLLLFLISLLLIQALYAQKTTIKKLVFDNKNCKLFFGILGPYKDFEFDGKCRKSSVHGFGRVTLNKSDSEKTIIKGNFNNGVPDGFLEIQFYNGIRFRGNIRKDQFYNIVELQSEDGNIYTGTWEKDQPVKGVFQFSSGTIYIGRFEIIDFFKGKLFIKRSGAGELILPNEKRYFGDFQENQLDGLGVFEWKNKTYSGEFKKDTRSGLGVLEFKNGNSYQGEFNNNLFNGTGKLKFSEKSEKKDEVGEFKDSKFIKVNTEGILTAAQAIRTRLKADGKKDEVINQSKDIMQKIAQRTLPAIRFFREAKISIAKIVNPLISSEYQTQVLDEIVGIYLLENNIKQLIEVLNQFKNYENKKAFQEIITALKAQDSNILTYQSHFKNSLNKKLKGFFEKGAFERAEELKSLAAYSYFVVSFPNSKFNEKAVEKIYSFYEEKNEIAGYENFIFNFSSFPEYEKAIRTLAQLYFEQKKEGSLKNMLENHAASKNIEFVYEKLLSLYSSSNKTSEIQLIAKSGPTKDIREMASDILPSNQRLSEQKKEISNEKEKEQVSKSKDDVTFNSSKNIKKLDDEYGVFFHIYKGEVSFLEAIEIEYLKDVNENYYERYIELVEGSKIPEESKKQLISNVKIAFKRSEQREKNVQEASSTSNRTVNSNSNKFDCKKQKDICLKKCEKLSSEYELFVGSKRGNCRTKCIADFICD